MKTTETQQWFYLMMLTIAGTVFFGFFYLFASLFIPPAEDVRDYYAGIVVFTEKSLPKQNQVKVVLPPPEEVYKDFYALQVNKPTPIEDYQVIYRGPESSGGFRLEVANSKLDSESYYTYTFSEKEIAGGIRIGGQRFTVLSARPRVLHLHRNTP